MVAIDQKKVNAVRAVIQTIADKDYHSDAMRDGIESMQKLLANSREGRALLPEIVQCMQNRHARRAMKLVGRRSGVFTGKDRVLLSALGGGILALIAAIPGLAVFPESARLAVPLLCAPSPETKPDDMSEKEKRNLPENPYHCPGTGLRLSNLSVSTTLLSIYWLPLTLISYVVLLLWIHRKRKN